MTAAILILTAISIAFPLVVWTVKGWLKRRREKRDRWKRTFGDWEP